MISILINRSTGKVSKAEQGGIVLIVSQCLRHRKTNNAPLGKRSIVCRYAVRVGVGAAFGVSRKLGILSVGSK